MNGFSLWVGLGTAIGLWRVANSAPRQQAGLWTNLSLAVLLTSLVGARAYYVWTSWRYYANHPAEIAQVWLGGLGWPGALGGAALAFALLPFVLRGTSAPGASPRETLSWIGDRLYPLMPPLALTTWLGCWQVGEAYGAPLPNGTWFGILSLDESGSFSLHLPLQFLAALTLLIFFWLLESRAQPMRPPGRISWLGTFGLLLHLLAASLLRGDPAPMWNHLRMETWAALFFLLIFLAASGLNLLFFRPAQETHLPFSERNPS